MKTPYDTYGKKRGKLKITQDRVVTIIMRTFDTKGLKEAQHTFDFLNSVLSTEKGWAETADEIYDLFAEIRKEQILAEREAKLEEQRAGAPSLVLVNKNEASGIKQIDQLNAGIEEGAEINHTKHN